MKARILFISLFLVAAFVACEEKTVPQNPDKPNEEKPTKPSTQDTVFYSYYGYVNYSKLPITIDVYWGFQTPSKQKSITIYPGDKYENRIAGAGYYPAPFNSGGQVFVTVSNTEKQFTQKENDKFAYLFNKYLHALLYEGESTKVYEYIFTGEDFEGGAPITENGIASLMASNKSASNERPPQHSCTSYYGYINQSSYPVITVEYHSSDYGYSLIPKSEKFAVNQWDKYEVCFTDIKYLEFPGPFAAAKAGDYVSVSNGEKQFVQQFEDGGRLFDIKSYKLVNDENGAKRVYEYAFTDEDFRNAVPVEG